MREFSLAYNEYQMSQQIKVLSYSQARTCKNWGGGNFEANVCKQMRHVVSVPKFISTLQMTKTDLCKKSSTKKNKRGIQCDKHKKEEKVKNLQKVKVMDQETMNLC